MNMYSITCSLEWGGVLLLSRIIMKQEDWKEYNVQITMH